MQVGDGVLLFGEADTAFCRTEQDFRFTKGATSPTSHLGFTLNILDDGRYICAQVTTKPKAGVGAMPLYNPGVFETPGVHLETGRANERAVVCTRFFLLVGLSDTAPYRSRYDVSPTLQQESVEHLQTKFKYRQLVEDIERSLDLASAAEVPIQTALVLQSTNIGNAEISQQPQATTHPTTEPPTKNGLALNSRATANGGPVVGQSCRKAIFSSRGD
ncbi:hypothetical protein PRZ48_010259 [Zasmidium cellare]|uniref:Uncharacterized protein n=1 Tax=Zasmidium cellare TaxID=395010 RepID=A0ABR0E8Q7_ZASCE|nr:hypothetical protein PRZ48_010259 [Zasmidium cellare]